MATIDRRCEHGHSVSAAAAFCPSCGSALGAATPPPARACPSGHPVSPTAAFCPACGQHVGGVAPPMVGSAALPTPHPGAYPPPMYPPAAYPATTYPPAAYPPAAYPSAAYPSAAYTPGPYVVPGVGTYPAGTSAPQGFAPWGSSYAYAPVGPLSGLAIAAFLVSLVWLYGVTSVVAIVLGGVALRRIKQREERGRGLAITAIVIGGVGILIALGVLAAHVH